MSAGAALLVFGVVVGIAAVVCIAWCMSDSPIMTKTTRTIEIEERAHEQRD